MPNKNKAPVDRYSRGEFENVLETLENSGITYEPRSDKREQSEDWQIIHAAATDEERATIEKLDRLYANAGREAIDEYIVAELLPKIEAMKRETEDALERASDAPPVARSLAHDIIAEATRAERLSKEKPGAHFGETIIAIFKVIREAFRRFKEYMQSFANSDRFGRDKGSSVA